MRSVKVMKPGVIEIVEVDNPIIEKNDDVKIKIKAVGICGSDVHILHGHNPFASYPRTIGHEMVGEVVEIGEGVSNVKIGDLVVVEPIVTCGKCYACRVGKHNVCKDLEVMGVHQDGGMQEFIVVPMKNVHRYNSKMTLEQAVMIEPFTIGAQSTSHAHIMPGDFVYVVGAGPIGQTIIQYAKARGAVVIASDIDQRRLQTAKSGGADYCINVLKEDEIKKLELITGEQGVNVIIDSACIPDMFNKFLKILSPAGRLVLLGFVDRDSIVQEVDFVKKGLEVYGSRLQANKFPEVIDLMEKGKLNPKLLVSHKFSFDDIKDAFKIVEDPNVETMKVIITF